MAKKVKRNKRKNALTEANMVTSQATKTAESVLSSSSEKIRLKNKTVDKLPTILKGGIEVPLSNEQKKKLKYTIQSFGSNSIEAKALMLEYASEARVDMKPRQVKPIKLTRSAFPLPYEKKKALKKSVVKIDISDVVKMIIDVLSLSDKREKVRDRKYKAADKKRYEVAANLRTRELGYTDLIQKKMWELGKLRKFVK